MLILAPLIRVSLLTVAPLPIINSMANLPVGQWCAEAGCLDVGDGAITLAHMGPLCLKTLQWGGYMQLTVRIISHCQFEPRKTADSSWRTHTHTHTAHTDLSSKARLRKQYGQTLLGTKTWRGGFRESFHARARRWACVRECVYTYTYM